LVKVKSNEEGNENESWEEVKIIAKLWGIMACKGTKMGTKQKNKGERRG
jgi:hypothetical protein